MKRNFCLSLRGEIGASCNNQHFDLSELGLARMRLPIIFLTVGPVKSMHATSIAIQNVDEELLDEIFALVAAIRS